MFVAFELLSKALNLLESSKFLSNDKDFSFSEASSSALRDEDIKIVFFKRSFTGSGINLDI